MYNNIVIDLVFWLQSVDSSQKDTATCKNTILWITKFIEELQFLIK